MLLPRWLKLVGLLLPTMLLTSCLGTPSPSPSAGAKLYTADAVKRMFPDILPAGRDQLTYGTACQIIEHDVTRWCEFPETAPVGFDAKTLCASGVKVCEKVLGPLQADAPPGA